MKKYKLYIISHGGTKSPFWESVKRGMVAAKKYLSTEANVEVEYLGPEGTDRYSIEEIENKINEAVAKGADGIAVTITDAERLDKLLKEIIERKKLPVIAINVPDFRSKVEGKIPYLFYIGMDEYVCGKRLAERMLSEFNPKSAVVGIHEKGHKGLEKMVEGIKDVLDKKGISTEVIDVGEDPHTMVNELKKYWTTHPDTNAIFMLNSVGTKAALNFLQENKLFQKVKLASVDLPKTFYSEISEAIKDGRIICIAEQGPFLQGFLSIYWLYQYCKSEGNLQHDDIFLGPTIVDKYNIEYIGSIEEKIIKNLEELLDNKRVTWKELFRKKLEWIRRYPVSIMIVIVTSFTIIAVFFNVKLIEEITVKEILGFIFYFVAIAYALAKELRLPKLLEK